MNDDRQRIVTGLVELRLVDIEAVRKLASEVDSGLRERVLTGLSMVERRLSGDGPDSTRFPTVDPGGE